MPIQLYADQHQGKRDYQEDSWQFIVENENTFLMVLCDGMGGHEGGKQASTLIVNSFIEHFKLHKNAPPEERLQDSLSAAHTVLKSYINDNKTIASMGTTLLAVYIMGNDIYWINVGDSPLFFIKYSEITRLNDDHSMMPVLTKMFQNGEITEKELKEDPRRHMLRSAISNNDINLIDFQVKKQFLENNDIIILASDGIETISLEQIAQISTPTFNEDNDPQITKKICTDLIKSINDKNTENQDNITIICYLHFAVHLPKKIPFWKKIFNSL